MARIDMDDFVEGEEIVRVYLAGALEEARRVEAVLDGAGVEYGVEVEAVGRRSVFGSGQRAGAGFWVRPDALDPAADALERAGLVAGLVERGAR